MWLSVWCAQVFLMHVPLAGRGPSTIPHLDKVAHAGLYFCLTLAGAVRLGVLRRRVAGRTLLLWALVYAVYGILDEQTQPWTGRTAELDDWLADLVGIAGATLLGAWLRPSGRPSEATK